MNSHLDWFLKKVSVSKFPTVDDLHDGKFDHFNVRINVSDIFRPEIDNVFKLQGTENFWFPLGEAFGMALDSLYGALRIIWEAAKQDQSLLLHCHAGRNRSVMVADCYYFLCTQEHRKKNQENFEYAKSNPNRLLLNVDDGQLPGIFKMEEFLECCLASFDDSFTEGDRPLDWIKHEMHLKGSGFTDLATFR